MTLRLAWLTPDPDGTALRLASSVGGRVDREPADASSELAPVVRFVGGSVMFLPGTGLDRLELRMASAEALDETPSLRGAPALLGVGWATVDTDRSLPALAASLGVAPAAFRSAAPDAWLGASATVARLGPHGFAILEPSTEGHLAAALARSGEGPCAVYVAYRASGGTRESPFGPSTLVMADRSSGPFVLALRRRSLGAR